MIICFVSQSPEFIYACLSSSHIIKGHNDEIAFSVTFNTPFLFSQSNSSNNFIQLLVMVDHNTKAVDGYKKMILEYLYR